MVSNIEKSLIKNLTDKINMKNIHKLKNDWL